MGLDIVRYVKAMYMNIIMYIIALCNLSISCKMEKYENNANFGPKMSLPFTGYK